MIDTSYSTRMKRNTITSPIKTTIQNIESENNYEKSEDQESYVYENENDENDENEEDNS